MSEKPYSPEKTGEAKGSDESGTPQGRGTVQPKKTTPENIQAFVVGQEVRVKQPPSSNILVVDKAVLNDKQWTYLLKDPETSKSYMNGQLVEESNLKRLRSTIIGIGLDPFVACFMGLFGGLLSTSSPAFIMRETVDQDLEKAEGSVVNDEYASGSTTLPASPTSTRTFADSKNGDLQPAGRIPLLRRVSAFLVSVKQNRDDLSKTQPRDLARQEVPEPARKDDPNRQVKIRQLHGGAKGYAIMGRFLDSDENYMIYRRFGHVQARLLLEAQEEVRFLEEDLDDLDALEAEQDGMLLNSKSRFSEERKELMKQLKVAFQNYASLMDSAKTLTSMHPPTNSEWDSAEIFMNNQKPVARRELEFIYQKEDLVTLRPGREYAWLDVQVQKFLKLFDGRLIRALFVDDMTAQKAGEDPERRGMDPLEVYFSRQRIKNFVSIILTVEILILLIVPTYILYHLTQESNNTNNTNTWGMSGSINASCMAVLLVFTLCFSASLSLLTSARRHEVLAAAAGYCAVLVVFIGNLSGSSHGSTKV